MYFEDRPGLKAKFPNFLENNVIARPQGAWLAMEAAGVSLLSRAVKIELLECDNPAKDLWLSNHVAERRPLIERVAEAQKANSGDPVNLIVLDDLNIQRSGLLKICYTLNAFNKSYSTEDEFSSAVFFDNVFYVTYADDQLQWPDFARELAVALQPVGEIGSFANGLHVALQSQTIQAAQQQLDTFGYPPLQHISATPSAASIVSNLGGQDKPDQPTDETPEQAVAGILGPDAPTPAFPPAMRSEFPEGTAGGGKVSGGPDERLGKPVPKLRSYVSHGSARKGSDVNKEAERKYNEIDQAGIKRVLEFEIQRGYAAHAMPHENEGYDIESTGPDGSMRYIEVKSTDGAWGNTSGLTAPQFKFAREHGEASWLYVVEFARNDAAFRIQRIQNPANRVTQFFFDSGWQDVAEPDEHVADPVREA